MSYLLFASHPAAEARSRAAYTPLRPDDEPDTGAVTDALWSIISHPTDGRGALLITDTPAAAGLGLDQAEYDALLTAGERAALIGQLPADWTPAPIG